MKISIISTYQTKFGELWDQSLENLIQESISGCLKSGQIDPSEVQSIYVGNMLAGITENQAHLGSTISQIIGTHAPVTRVEAACASGGLAVHTAIQAILAGSIDNALVLGVEKMTDVNTETISNALMAAADPQARAAGLNFPGLYAIMANAYFDSYENKLSDLAQIPVKNHFHAQYNPKAQYQFAITSDQVHKSSKVADPLRLLDCSPITDGAAAIFIASPEWVKIHNKQNGVHITGSAMATDCIGLGDRLSLTSLASTKIAAQKAYSQAGIEVKDINLAEVHDCFSIAEVLAVEDLGFYPAGEAINYQTKKQTWLGGKRPINTSGGLKACGHPIGATGVKQIVEATLQLKQQAKDRQVKDANVAITQNVGGTGGTAVVHVLQK